MPHFRVIAPHHPPNYAPLKLQAGASATVGRRDDEWPEFLWCTTDDGQAGWIPESHLDREGDDAVVNRDYDSTELAAEIGEQVTSSEEVGGWLWCRNERGASGWIPVRCLERD